MRETIQKRTKNTFIKVARMLFAKIGYEATTMDRIAKESKKGRRTLYTYFNSKSDIFATVIEEEVKTLTEEITKFAARDIRPSEKLMRYIYFRLEAIKDVVERNGSLEAPFFRDIGLVERVRLRFDVQETLVLRRMLRQGIEDGTFRQMDVNFCANVIHSSLKGLEVPYIKGQLMRHSKGESALHSRIAYLILNGIKK